MSKQTSPTAAVVIGAGMVGVSTALALQRRGVAVTLIDRREPGRETSYGNAGIVSSGSILPINGPALWGSLPAYLGNRHPALRWRATWPFTNAAWSLRFLGNATQAATKPRSVALHGLIGASVKLHRDWIVRAGAGHRLRETGWLKAWRSESRASAEAEHAVLSAFGIGSEILDRQGISALEPSITPVFRTGLLHTETASVDSPGAVVTAYADMFAKGGGTILRGEVKSITPSGDGWLVRYGDGEMTARQVVVALGPWSADLLGPLGYRVPLAFERGYHQEFKAGTARRISRPIHDSDYGYLMTPMENGVRITSGVELAHREAPSSFAQLDEVVPQARGVVDLGERVGERWRGARPTLPDSLPMIGAAPHHHGLWLAFGHQHIGFTTGPATGEAIAALMTGAPPPFDVQPFAPSRYL